MGDVTLQLDPYITTANDTKVDRVEMVKRHGPVPDSSGYGVWVGIMDTGVAQTNEFVSKQINGYDKVEIVDSISGDAVGHGTMVADMATRYAGGVNLVDFKIFGDSGKTAKSAIYEALNVAIAYAKNGKLDVLNMSFGSQRIDTKMDLLVNELSRNGCIPVAAAGNSGGGAGSPAHAKHAISVGALQEHGERMTNFSSWDMDDEADPGFPGQPDVCAIGKNVVGARAAGTSMGNPINDELTKASGTSFSAPFVTGVVADLLRRRPELSTKEVLWLLERSAVDVPGTHRDGLGRVSWRSAANMRPEDLPWKSGAKVWTLPYSGGDWIHVNEDTLESGKYEVNLDKLREAMEKE